MGKKSSLPHLPTPPPRPKKEGDHTQNSLAIQRVITNNTFDGVFLSNSQLIALGTQLANIENGPLGVWFMIGKGLNFGVIVQSVEIIPIKYDTVNHIPEFYINGNLAGQINVNLGTGFGDGPPLEIVSIYEDTGPIRDGISSQRTPPPHPDE